jgi:flagellar motor switch protein FliN/FliY
MAENDETEAPEASEIEADAPAGGDAGGEPTDQSAHQIDDSLEEFDEGQADADAKAPEAAATAEDGSLGELMVGGEGDGSEGPDHSDIDAVFDVPVQLSAVLGSATMQVAQLLKLGRGAVVELDRKVGEAIDIYVNNRLVARGEVVVVEERLGVTMTEIIKSDRGS